MCLVSANDVMEPFAFPGNKAHFHVLFMKGCYVTNCFLGEGSDTPYFNEDVVEDGRNGWMVGIRK